MTQYQNPAAMTENWIEQLVLQLDSSRQRALVSCQGSVQWCDLVYGAISHRCEDVIVLSDQATKFQAIRSQAVPFSKSETLLGQEARIVVVDLFQGLNPDVLCIAVGLVKCGGVLVLLSPHPENWNQINDHYGVWQNQLVSPEFLFIDYFFEKVSAGKDSCMLLREGQEVPPIAVAPQARVTELVNGETRDQTEVLKTIEAWVSQVEQTIVLITANRGRGKSTCLGFAVRKLVEDYGLCVCVTAYSRQSAKMLLAQYGAADFIAPDQLINEQRTGDILVIDEAAMLPYTILDQLCRLFERVIMATTTGGYEGSGQGFLLRFVARFSSDELLWLKLLQPIRWADNDCLENWVDDTLMLKPDFSISGANDSDTSLDSSSCQYELLDRKLDASRLTQFYRLMVSAHYRTRPSDLRALMENPDLVPILAEYNHQLTGVALLNREGDFEDALCEQVFLGMRRPKGHLLAQMLTAQAGIRDFATYKGLRIQRIAVKESLRRRGIGQGLNDSINKYANAEGFDYIGASFAFDSQSAGFWQSCGFRLVHIGYGQGKSSGNQSVAVVKVLNNALEEKIEQLQGKIRDSLPLWFCQFLSRMSVDDVVSLLRFSGYSARLTDLEKDEVEAFMHGNKGFELCFVSLQRVVMHSIVRSPVGSDIHPWLIEKIVQNKSWYSLSSDIVGKGRKQAQSKLRLLVEELISID